MDLLLIVLVGVIAIAVVTSVAQRLGVAGPLLLVGLGLIVSLLPFVPTVVIDPEWILVGVLPPLLYASAVRLPAIEFRRDFGPIAGLSLVLVVLSSLALGAFFYLAIPEVGFPLGVALGAILSPTDAVATSIAKRLGISPRVVTMLEGESLLNDATALVILRTALVAVAGSFSLWGAIGEFARGVFVALVIGALVGSLATRLRGVVRNSAAATAISFTVPFIAYLPTERLDGSGLVAAVVAGLVAGQGAARRLTPEERMSDELNWRTIELVLEGAVFLGMGLELRDIVNQNLELHDGLWRGIWLALVAMLIIVVVRAAYVAFLVQAQGRRARRMNRERLEQMSARIEEAAASPERIAEARLGPGDPARRIETMRSRIARTLADMDYYQASPLGWKHGTIIVWAGMRGVVTLAAAQTLPREGTAGERALLVFVAFLVALISLLLQGFTLPWLVRRLGLVGTGAENEQAARDEQMRLQTELRAAAAAALSEQEILDREGNPFAPDLVKQVVARIAQPPDDDTSIIARRVGELRIVMIEAQRARLIELTHGGSFSTAALRHALAELDADQLSIELRLGRDDD